MAEEIVKVISVDTKKSEKSLKGLKKEVKDLKREMEELVIGSDEWARKVQELDEAQDNLNASTLAAKGYATNLAAVYDSTAQIVSGLAAGMSAVNAVTVMFGSENEDLAKTMVKLQAAMALVQGLQGLRGMGAGIERAIKAFRAMTVSMGTASASAKGFAASMAVVKTAIVQTGIGALVVVLGVLIDKFTKFMKETSNVTKAANAAEVIESSFNKMIKISNKDLEEFEIIRERALAEGTKDEIKIWELYVLNLKRELTNASEIVKEYNNRYINQFSQILQSNKKIRKEFAKSPYANTKDQDLAWQVYSKNLFSQVADLALVHQQLEKLLSADEMAVVDDIIEKYKSANEEVASLEQKIAETSEQIVLMKIKREKEVKDAIIAENEELIKELQTLREDDLKMLLTEEEVEDKEIIDSINKQIALIQKAYERGLINKEKYDEYLLFANEAHKMQMWKLTKERIDGELDIELEGIQARRDALNEFYDNREAALEAYYSKTYETFRMGGYYQSSKDRKKEYEDAITYANQLLAYRTSMYGADNALIGEQESVAQKQKDSDLKILQEQLTAKLITEEDYNNQKLEIEKAYNTAVEDLALQREANDIALKNAEIERDNVVTEQKKKNIETINSAMMSTYSVASSLTGALANVYKQESQSAKNSEKEQQKAFKTYKALAITQAIIDTISSAQGAYSSMIGIPYVGPVLAPIAAAAAMVAGVANVKAIQNEQLAASSASGGSTASVTPPSALQTAPISYTRNLLGNKETDELNKATKVYVLESDITEVQNRVKVVEDNASF